MSWAGQARWRGFCSTTGTITAAAAKVQQTAQFDCGSLTVAVSVTAATAAAPAVDDLCSLGLSYPLAHQQHKLSTAEGAAAAVSRSGVLRSAWAGSRQRCLVAV